MPGQPLREHRLARARRADHQQAVRAGRGDGERSLRLLLPAHVGEVGRAGVTAPRARARGATRASDSRPVRCAHTASSDVAGMIVASRTSAASAALAAGSTKARPSRRADSAIGKRAADRPQRAAQRQLTGELEARQRGVRDLAGRREDADRDRQIVAPRLLGQIGGREVDRDLARREIELRVLQRGAHAVARFLDLGVGQADEIERRQPAGEVDFDRDERGLEPGETAREDDRERHRQLLSEVAARAMAVVAWRRGDHVRLG